MIEIYQWNHAGRCRLVGTYDTYYKMFFDYTETRINSEFGHVHSQKTTNVHYLFNNRVPCDVLEYVKIAYEDGKFVSPDRLIGLERKIGWYGKTQRKKRNDYWRQRYNSWSKSSKYCQWRQAKTFNERRQNVVVDDLEPPIRGKRKPINLPSWWDDRTRHYEKNWKKSRKTQWKSQK